MAYLRTTGFNGYAVRRDSVAAVWRKDSIAINRPCQVEWSPFEPNRLACAAAQHFGIVGNGRLYIVDILPNFELVIIGHFDTKDGLYDCSWSETNERLVIGGSGDGTVKLWDISLPGRPARVYEEHTKEVSPNGLYLLYHQIYSSIFYSYYYAVFFLWWHN
jgi:WD40 repeat protein